MMGVEKFVLIAVFGLLTKTESTDTNLMNDLRKEIMQEMKAELELRDEMIAELKRDLRTIKNPPYESVCGYNYDCRDVDSILTYNSPLHHLSTNIGSGVCPPDSSGGCVKNGGLNPDTGVYTASWSGDYMITWTSVALPDSYDDKIYIYLYHNGERVTESVQESYFGGDSGYIADTGSRTLFRRLELEDTLYLICKNCSGEIFKTTFCITMIRFDVL